MNTAWFKYYSDSSLLQEFDIGASNHDLVMEKSILIVRIQLPIDFRLMDKGPEVYIANT